MKRNRFTEEQIIGILKEHEAGTPVSELCGKHGVSDACIYKWKAKFGGWRTPAEFAQAINPRRDAAQRSPNASAPQPGATPSRMQQPKTAGANSKLDKTWGQGQRMTAAQLARIICLIRLSEYRFQGIRERSAIVAAPQRHKNPGTK